MKTLVANTLLFMGALCLGVHLRNSDFKEQHDSGVERRADGPQEFAKFHQGIRTRSDQQKPGYPANYQLTELQKALRFSAAKKSNVTKVQSNQNGVSAFIERGPGSVPGRTRGLLVDPDDATHKTWYAGSASGGVWKTVNAGTKWTWLTPNVPNMATTCIAMAESNHNVIYAGTGEGFGSLDGVDGMGIFKSTDRGATWNVLPNSTSLVNVNRILVDPSNENHVVAASIVNAAQPSSGGIFVSNDGGNSWTKVYTGKVEDLRATPGNFSILYGGENSVGVIKSVDGGANWAKSNAGMDPNGRVEICVSPVKTDRLVASAEGYLSGTSIGLTNSSDFYMSDDAGVTWSLVTLTENTTIIDYLGDQGWYDNTVAFSPYNKDVVYVAGVSAFQITLGSQLTGTANSYAINQINTAFLSLTKFTAATTGGGTLSTGTAANKDTIEIRFGPGISQSAHRFLVPTGATSGVPDASYTYQDYVNVPFQVWDKKTNQQLMVSFRDQNRNGAFDLITSNTSADDPTQQSREYLYINNVPYNTSPNSSIAQPGGQTYQEMFFFWPVLASGATWSPNSLPTSKLQIVFAGTRGIYTSTVKTVADAYNGYDGVNNRLAVHPDHHNIYPIKQNDATQQFQLLLANDGGVYLSGASASPGTTQGEWKKVGATYNTSQVYGADKKPGAQEYFAGMQDNATYFTPSGTVSSASSNFITDTKLAGDGFEVLWHTGDGNKMIGGSQGNNFARSVDGGATWTSAVSGFPLTGGVPTSGKFPFISKLAGSKQTPDNIYTVGSDGVWRSTNFGSSWTLTAIGAGWGTMTSFTDVEVSRANPNIVWAGSGQHGSTTLFVSTNAGQTFTSVPNPVGYTLGSITRIATHPLEPNTAYALYSFAKTAKILKTTNLGQTWTDISGFGTNTSSSTGFPDVAVYSLYVRLDDPNIIWAGTEIGIVESLDGGATWAILTSFPAVGVWDMKGQDKEIVIGTHGRGIWTASVGADQIGVSKIIASGTTPQSKFALLIQVPYKYDSILINFTAAGTLKFLPPDSGTYALRISNVPVGNLTMQTFSYRNGVSTSSTPFSGTNLKLNGYQQKYYDYLVDASKFSVNGFNVAPFGLSNTSLQSLHNYAANSSATATLLVPIIVSAGSSSFIYDDVALVQLPATGAVFGQPGFNDYVIAEATKDGLHWTPIANGYNSSANADWSSAIQASKLGDISMTKTENFDLKANFAAGDTLLVRFRLTSNSDNIVGWGWSIDNLYIQQTPTAVEPSGIVALTISPNPSSGKFYVSYSLPQASDVMLSAWDVTGKLVLSQDLGAQPVGKNEAEFDLHGMTEGIYFARVKTVGGEQTIKLFLKK